MHYLVTLLVLVTAVQCIANGEGSENGLGEQNAPEESRFRKFLNLFGIGSSNQFDRGDFSRHYQPYGYPCPVQTTTTPAPVLSPLLCPFPPMLPAQLNSGRNPVNGQFPSALPHHQSPPGMGQFPPPPQGISSLPPPPSGISSLPAPPAGTYPPLYPPSNESSARPQPPFPGSSPQSPFPGQPPHVFIPPGLKPDQLLPPSGPYPGHSIPTPIPIQNLPQPVQPGQGGPSVSPLPTFPGPLYPSNIDPSQNPVKSTSPSLVANSGSHPEKPVMVDPVNPENPVKVNPVVTDPSNPVKVIPALVDPTKPVQVKPISFNPSNPIVVDPVQPNSPLLVNPSNDQPLIDPFKPFLNEKGFSKQPPLPLPYGPMNVLINPGLPERPLTKPPKPLKPELPKPEKIPPPPFDPFLANKKPFNDGFTSYHPGPGQGLPYPPNFGNNGILIGPILSHGIGQLHPPPTSNLVVPTPPSLNQIHQKLPPLRPPHNNNDAPLLPNVHESQFPPKGIQPQHPVPVLPPTPPKQQEPTGGSACGNPFLRPYVPPGFHLSSINQFLGIPPPSSTPRLIYPCPTADLLKALDFKIMRSLIVSSGLLPLFEHTGNYTLFVPSDAAFRRLPRWFRDSLDVDKKLKKALVLNLLVKQDLPLNVLENEELVLTARPGGHRLRINIYQQENTYRTITIDGSEVEKGDILTSTGRVHIVNKVLMPNLPRNAAQFLSEKLEFESFWNLVKQADLLETFQSPRPFTLFIPVNEAVRRINDSTFFSDKEKLRNFISYHIVNVSHYSNGIINNEFLLTNYEKEVKLQVVSDNFAKSLSSINGNVRILKSDITLTNGVAHVIDRCISEETPFYVYPQSDEFKNEYGVMKRSFRVTSEEKNISNAF